MAGKQAFDTDKYTRMLIIAIAVSLILLAVVGILLVLKTPSADSNENSQPVSTTPFQTPVPTPVVYDERDYDGQDYFAYETFENRVDMYGKNPDVNRKIFSGVAPEYPDFIGVGPAGFFAAERLSRQEETSWRKNYV
ncbi:MAG: hypothetical protein WC346_08815 [Methanogenium sp.]|jgi:hypothetical protein